MGNVFGKDITIDVIYHPSNLQVKEKIKIVNLKNEILHLKAESKIPDSHPNETIIKYFDHKPFFKVEITMNDYAMLGTNEYYPLREPQIRDIEKILGFQKKDLKQFIELQDLFFMGLLKNIRLQKEAALFGSYDKEYLCKLMNDHFKKTNSLVLTVVPRISDKNFQNHYYSSEQTKLRIEEYKKMSKEMILNQLNILDKIKEKNKIITDDIVYLYDSIKDISKQEIITNYVNKIVMIEDRLLQADMYIQKYGFKFLTISDNYKYILGNTLSEIMKYCS